MSTSGSSSARGRIPTAAARPPAHAWSGSGVPLAGDDDAFPAVRIFVAGSGWRDLQAWPPPAEDRTFFLHPGSLLAEEPPSPDAPPSRFVYNPADPTPTIGGRLLSGGSGFRDDSALAARTDVAAFTSPVLTGRRGGHRHTAGGVGAFGRHRLGRCLRPDQRRRRAGRSRNVGDGYRRLESAVAGQLRIDLDPVAHRFPAGHRIRLTVAGGSYPGSPAIWAPASPR